MCDTVAVVDSDCDIDKLGRMKIDGSTWGNMVCAVVGSTIVDLELTVDEELELY